MDLLPRDPHTGSRVAAQARHSTLLDRLVRWGLVSYGVVHLLIGWLALQVALGSRDGSVSKSGALHEVMEQPGGQLLMWLLVLGFAALVGWQLLEAAVGHHDETGAKRWLARGASLIKAAIYGTLGFTAATLAAGEPSKGSGTDGFTASLMSLPLGQLLVGAVGVAVIGYAVYQVSMGLSDGWEEHVEPDATTGTRGRVVSTLARIGYPSRGVAFGIIGGLFVWAAVTHDPKKSGGLDVALSQLARSGLGTVLLFAVALGFACFGVFCFAWARHFRA